jgi:hypothetical protein
MTATLQRVLELLSLVAVVATWIVAVRAYPRLPPRVPTHFGFSGRPDAWGRKETIFLLPVVSLAIYLLQWRVMGLVGREMPSTGFTLVLALLRLETAALMLAIERGMIAVARGRAGRLGNSIWLYTGAILLTSLLLAVAAPPKSARRHAEGARGPLPVAAAITPTFYARQLSQPLPDADLAEQAPRPILYAG